MSPVLGIARRGVRRAVDRAVRRTAAGVVVSVGAALAAACGPQEPRSLRAWSDSYEFRITADPSPPHASEPTLYRVVVLDRKSGQPIEGGEGQIFATSLDRVNRYDSFEPAPEVGTYTARMTFVTAGDWNVALRFRRDSTARLEQVSDWVQTVYAARPISQRPFK